MQRHAPRQQEAFSWPEQLAFSDELLFSEPRGEELPSQIRERPLPVEYIPVFAVKLVRAQYVPLEERTKIRTPRNMALNKHSC